jgi:hypothetical protein
LSIQLLLELVELVQHQVLLELLEEIQYFQPLLLTVAVVVVQHKQELMVDQAAVVVHLEVFQVVLGILRALHHHKVAMEVLA